MPFSAEDIESKQFLVGMRGYDQQEVAAFLRAVAADYRQLQHGGSGDPYGEAGKAIADLIRSANEKASEIRTEAERSAADVLERAHRLAAEVAERAQSEADALLAEARLFLGAIQADLERHAAALADRSAAAGTDATDATDPTAPDGETDEKPTGAVIETGPPPAAVSAP